MRILVAAVLCSAGAASGAAAQVSATVGMAASRVTYDGFLPTNAGVFGSTIRFDSRRFSLATQGNWTEFESGNSVLQGTVGAAWLAARRQSWRLELSGSGGVSRYAMDPATGHLRGGLRLHVNGAESGGWLGLSAGRLSDSGGRPVSLAAAVWMAKNGLALLGTATASWVRKETYVDLTGGARWSAGPAEVELRLNLRPVSRTRGAVGDAVLGGWGEVAAGIPLTRRLALSVVAGSYPTDPTRRVLGAKHLTAGLELRLGRDRLARDEELTAVMRRAARGPESGAAARLELVPATLGPRIRIVAPGARSVELMGDFTDWEPVLLDQVGAGVWELPRILPAGTHRFNIRIDGGAWIVPRGVRQETTDFGGEAGLLFIPG